LSFISFLLVISSYIVPEQKPGYPPQRRKVRKEKYLFFIRLKPLRTLGQSRNNLAFSSVVSA
jgi:hypothetical protein